MSDLIKRLTNYRIKGIEKAEIEYYEALTKTLDRIEDQIIALADKDLPRQAGKLIELQSAVAIRPKIKEYLIKNIYHLQIELLEKVFQHKLKELRDNLKQ